MPQTPSIRGHFAIEYDLPGQRLSLSSRLPNNRLSFDGEAARLRIESPGSSPSKPDAWQIPFSAITLVTFSVGPERGAAEVSLQMKIEHYASGEEVEYLEIPFTVEALNLRAKAMDFAFRVAQITRASRDSRAALDWYRVSRCDAQRFEIVLCREQGEEAHPIPPIEEKADYKQGASRFTVPAYQDVPAGEQPPKPPVDTRTTKAGRVALTALLTIAQIGVVIVVVSMCAQSCSDVTRTNAELFHPLIFLIFGWFELLFLFLGKAILPLVIGASLTVIIALSLKSVNRKR